jgi:DNA-binding protein HU-alpha
MGEELAMTKEEFVAQVRQGCAELALSQSQARQVVEQVFATLTAALQREGEQAIYGFGTFTRRHRPARTGRHPQTGAPLTIAASYTVGFRPGSALRKAVMPPQRTRAKQAAAQKTPAKKRPGKRTR